MRLINIDNLQEGMQLGQDLYDEYNRLLLGRGAPVRSAYIVRLKQMGLPALYIQDDDTSDIPSPEPIPPAVRARAVQNLTSAFQTVSKSLEGLRKLSVEEAHQHIRSKRFSEAFRSVRGEQGFQQIVGDVDSLVDQLMNREVVVGLNSIKTHDSYTFQHCLDVTIMALVLARKIGWNKERLTVFGIGCLLHDIGKILIGHEILNKPGRLTDEEFETMKSHPTLGYELIHAIAPKTNTLVSHVAYQHHERQDGSGYPRGLKGNPELGLNAPNTIHDFGAVAAVADIYDAMASDRPYRQGWPPDRVVALIRDLSGSHLNSRVVDIFTHTVAPYPIGTNVRVQNGAYAGYQGVIADVDDRQLDRPIVRLLFDPQNNRIDAVQMDLREEADVAVESVRNGDPDVEPRGSSRTVATVQPVDSKPEQTPQASPAIVKKTYCPQCGYENASGAKICSGCGIPFVLACPSCDHENNAAAKFCSECGASLNKA